MTVYEDEIEVRRPSVGTKVLGLACAILAVLGSFWGIVWFIRAYVEPPRVLMPAGLSLASRESTPAPAPMPDPKAAEPVPLIEAQTAPPLAAQPAPAPSPRAALAAQREAAEPPTGAVADRLAPINQIAVPPAAPALAPAQARAAPAPAESTAALTTDTEAEQGEQVVEESVPAIQGPAPLPRRKPTMTASARRSDPPLPRPRPDGQTAPQRVWTAVPPTDERFSTGQ
jgi:hypothetical protein